MSKFITIIRPDFMEFCIDACRSAAFNHLLFRIAGKAKDQPKEKIQAGDILWYAKTEQIVEEMSHAWGDCKVRKEVNALINMGIIGRRSNPEWGADRTKHFCFGQEQCAKFLELCQEHSICVVHLGLSPEVTHLIYSSNANDKSIKCICSKHQMDAIHLSNASDESIGAIPIDSPTEDDYKEEESVGAIAQHAPTLEEIDELRERTDDTLEEVKTASGKIKAMPKGATDDSNRHIPGSYSGYADRMVPVHSSGTPGNQDGITPPERTQVAISSSESVAVAASPSPPAVAGFPSSSSTTQRAAGGNGFKHIIPDRSGKPTQAPLPEPREPTMALTSKQVGKQNDLRAGEIWSLVERELGRKFTKTQRAYSKHAQGMQNMIEDQATDADIVRALKTVREQKDSFLRDNFTLTLFHARMPNLLPAQQAPPPRPKPSVSKEPMLPVLAPVRNGRR